ncbi:MAG: heavy-metal-associated domain-containing protein [Gammaproteobacteria bacterium]|nr:heavy-metal-associated domain-containing protein [Gammaproteobacteria bacterium]
MQEHFRVKNVKCGGCVKTIQQGLQGLTGVASVSVVIDTGQVTVEGANLDHAQLSSTLSKLGYPEV